MRSLSLISVISLRYSGDNGWLRTADSSAESDDAGKTYQLVENIHGDRTSSEPTPYYVVGIFAPPLNNS